MIVADAQRGEKMCSDLRFFLTGELVVNSFFEWEVLPFDPLSPTTIVSAARMRALSDLVKQSPGITVASARALTQRILPVEVFRSHVIDLEVGMEISREAVVARFDSLGYVLSSLVEDIGQMAVRGAVVDIYPPGEPGAVRIEFFGDKIVSLRNFQPATQRSTSSTERVSVIPVREFFGEMEASAVNRLRARASELSLPRASILPIEEAVCSGSTWPGIEHLYPLVAPATATLWEYFPPGSLVFVSDQASVLQNADAYTELVCERAAAAESDGRLHAAPETAYAASEEFSSELAERVTHSFWPDSYVDASELSESERLSFESARSRQVFLNTELHTKLAVSRITERPLAPLADEITKWRRKGFRVLLISELASRRKRLGELLSHYDVGSTEIDVSFPEWLQESSSRMEGSDAALFVSPLTQGFRDEKRKFVIITEHEIFPETRRHRPAAGAGSVRHFLSSTSQLAENDFVVHIDYGIAIYRGLREIDVEGKPGDFLELEYAESAKLYVPVENIGKVQKYRGGHGVEPSLTKLGGKVWEKAKSKVRKNVVELAGHLLNTMAAREMSKGISFGDTDTHDMEFAAAFPYEETPDQKRAIEEVLGDMARERPMDRLVCGDVGYGKTEVALRAAFKAANLGKQTAVLVPTTVLADQHFQTFTERFKDTAITIGCVSRFCPAAQNRETIRRIAAGTIDIVIGTHRLFQKDVVFKDLGLVVIDEEHRFGVSHKEKLKRLRSEVDVLTLTATPIPRTLHMSLSGMREMSLIETPPVNRQVIRTYVANYDDQLVREAILRELERNGQVFYIHNRVQNISAVCDELRELLPEARFEIAHGQMKERQLEQVMHRFVEHKVDVLVSTTIVESGLDIANANTIIIRNADRFGLAELYQLRGRVGRSSRRAYSYLLIKDPNKLGANAKKRLAVLQSLDDLGVGFRLALEDLEIRGAGNLLGKDQSGHIGAIGYELYSRILKEAIEALKRIRDKDSTDVSALEVDPEINIGFPAHIPNFYIPDVGERLLLYQRLIAITSSDEARALGEEIEDRFGVMPQEVEHVLELMEFRALLCRAGIVSANYKESTLRFKFHKDCRLDHDLVRKLAAESGDELRLSPAMVFSLDIGGDEAASPGVLSARLKPWLKKIGVCL